MTQSTTTYFNDSNKSPVNNRQTSDVEGTNPYTVVSEFDSDTDSPGGRSGVDLKIKGSKGA